MVQYNVHVTLVCVCRGEMRDYEDKDRVRLRGDSTLKVCDTKELSIISINIQSLATP
jgi:hypothetical protein